MQVDPTRVRPYYDTLGDGVIQLSFTLPLEAGAQADQAALSMLRRMNLTDVTLAEKKAIAPGFSFYVAYARTGFSVDATQWSEPERAVLTERETVELARKHFQRKLVLVGATLESDAHTVGLDAIFNPKGFAGRHGLEHYPCFRAFNLGAQVGFRRLIEVVRREKADAVLISQTITQKGLHLKNLTAMADLLEAEGLRSGLVLIVGGPRITPELAKELGYDAGFGRGTTPEQVAAFVVAEAVRRQNEQ